MSWTTALVDLRNLLSDGPMDKYRYRKKVFGQIDGVNTRFKTFEFRRITDFKQDLKPQGVWLNGSILNSTDISVDTLQTGDFELSVAPADGSILEASYYIQWFLDSEITIFITTASQWLAVGSDFTTIQEGLRPAALKYAAAEAYQKLALRWSEQSSEGFLLDDAPDEKRMNIVNQYLNASTTLRKDAEAIRDDFYSRSGQQKQPSFGMLMGNVSDPVPKR